MFVINLHTVKEPDLSVHPRIAYPGEMPRFELADQWYTLGDLHGNPLKLLFFATLIGAVVISPADYKLFADLYEKGLVSQSGDTLVPNTDNVAQFNQLLQRIEVNPNTKIRLIGDELADRGRNDYFTLKLINRFIEKGAELEIIYSNHSYCLLKHIETAIATAEGENQSFDMDLFRTTLEKDPGEDLGTKEEGFTRSMHGLIESVRAGAVDAGEVLNLYRKYKRCVKAFSYDYNQEGNLVVYSHAPTDFMQHIYGTFVEFSSKMNPEQLERLKPVFEKVRASQTPELSDADKISLIDAINHVVQFVADHDFLAMLCVSVSEDTDGMSLFSSVIENRERTLLQDTQTLGVHGHDTDNFGVNRLSLDSVCGREDKANFPHLAELDQLLFTQTFEQKPEPRPAPTSASPPKRFKS